MDEYIMTNDDDVIEESYEDSYDDVTLDDVDTYLESVKEDIINAVNLYDDMVQEGYEYEDMSVEDLEMFIESTINDYNDGVDLYNTMIMESDDNVTDDIEESRDPSWSGENNGSDPRADRRKYMNDPNVQPWDKKQILDRANKADDLSLKRVMRRSRRDNVEEMPSRQYLMWKKDRDTWNDVADRDENEGLTHVAATSRKRANDSQRLMNDIKDQRLAGRRASVNEYALTSYRDNVVDLELDEPLTAYEFFDESYEPDDSPIVPYSSEGIYLEEKEDISVVGGVALGAAISAALGAAIATGITILENLITEKKYGRFPKDMKRLYQIVESENFEASENKRALKKAFKAIAKDLRWMLTGFGSRWKITVNEAQEIKKFKDHIDDLYSMGWMLSKDKETSNTRRVPERIKDMIEQGNKVLKILNKSVYKNSASDAVTEWMV